MSVPPRPDVEEPQPARWRAVEAIPVFIIAILIGGILAAPVSVLVTSCGGRFALVTLLGEAGFLLSVLLWLRFVDHAPLSALGLPREPLRDLAIGVGAGLVLVVAGNLVVGVAGSLVRAIIGHPPPEAQQVEACVRGPALALLGPVVVLAAPICEETLFRGFLYKGLRMRYAVWPAAVISAVFFGLVHLQPQSLHAVEGTALLVPGLVVVGLGLALVYERRQSLLASVAAHAAFNLVGYLLIAHGRL